MLTSIYTLQFCGISLTMFKESRIFWPSSCVDPSVKGTDKFQKVRGIIYGFNESRRHIAYGIESMADESTSAMRFRTTPKGYLLHYSFIFRKPELLGIEIKIVA